MARQRRRGGSEGDAEYADCQTRTSARETPLMARDEVVDFVQQRDREETRQLESLIHERAAMAESEVTTAPPAAAPPVARATPSIQGSVLPVVKAAVTGTVESVVEGGKNIAE